MDLYRNRRFHLQKYEKKIGTLTSGKYADMVIMDRDLFNSTPQEILHSEVMETLVGGKVVYEA